MSNPSVPDPGSASHDHQTNEIAQILELIRAEYDQVVPLIGQDEAARLLAEIWSKEELALILSNGWSKEEIALLLSNLH